MKVLVKFINVHTSPTKKFQLIKRATQKRISMALNVSSFLLIGSFSLDATPKEHVITI